MAFTHALAGDTDTSLEIAYTSLRAMAPNDSARLAQLYGLLSNQVYRMGFEKYALPLAREALDQAHKSKNPGMIAAVIPSLARIQAGQGKFEMAEESLRQARAEQGRMKEGVRESVALELNLICGQIEIGTKHFTEAEECLQENVQIIKSFPRMPPDLTVQTLLQLAQVSGARGRDDETRRHLKAATEVIEQNDQYFGSVALRMPFENVRRMSYDEAITFEYDHDGKDDAWGYVQRYRSKLFLEFLTRMNPDVSEILLKAVDRNTVQQLIPENVQTLEYILLKDRLLIWVVSCDKFESVSVPITRQELEKKVSAFVELTTAEGDVQAASEDLYNLLILPVAQYLDSKRSLAIIPDQALHRLNFSALYSPQSKKFLVQEFPIVESPNLTTLLSGNSAIPARTPAISFGSLHDDTGVTKELGKLQVYYPASNPLIVQKPLRRLSCRPWGTRRYSTSPAIHRTPRTLSDRRSCSMVTMKVRIASRPSTSPGTRCPQTPSLFLRRAILR
jgi:tetratricopeptide (TPR) repeat protein